MLETHFDVSNLPSTDRVVEIESVKEESPQIRQATRDRANRSTQSKGKDRETLDSYLPSPSPTPSPAPGHEENSSTSPTGGESAPSTNPGPAGSSRRLGKFQPTAPAPKDITSRVDKANIIPEGVKRSRERSRKHAYAIAVENVDKVGDEVFHGAFGAHSSAQH